MIPHLSGEARQEGIIALIEQTVWEKLVQQLKKERLAYREGYRDKAPLRNVHIRDGAKIVALEWDWVSFRKLIIHHMVEWVDLDMIMQQLRDAVAYLTDIRDSPFTVA